MVTGLIIVGAIVWLIGSIVSLNDMLKTGKSMEDYRAKYGHDLGFLICCLYYGLMIAAWPVMGLGGFGLGLITDSVRFIMRRPPKSKNNK